MAVIQACQAGYLAMNRMMEVWQKKKEKGNRMKKTS